MTPPFHVVLHQPEIPPNTGNILRLCAATGSVLHLVGPLGFRLDGAAVRRAGMDYRAWAKVQRWVDWPAYEKSQPDRSRLFAITTKGKTAHTKMAYQPGDRFLFGCEGAGLPGAILQTLPEPLLRIPMVSRARSLNLANSVAIVLFEALRQTGFLGMDF